MADRAMRPFWMHQLAEYVLGIAMISVGVQDPLPLMPSVAGVLILVNASLVHGPLGAFKFVSRRQHRTLDLVVMGAIALGAVQPWIPVSPGGRISMLAMLVPLGFVWWFTDFANRRERQQRRRGITGTGTGSDSDGPTSAVRGEQMGRRAGRVAGATYRAARSEVRKRTAADD